MTGAAHHNQHATPWDEETRARTIGMKRAGMQASVIAERLSITKGAVESICRQAGARKSLHGRTNQHPPRGRLSVLRSPHDLIEED